MPALSNGKGLLVRLHVNDGPLESVVEVHGADLRRLQCIHDQDFNGLVPAHNVDFFTKELVDDVLDSRATNPHASADAVDVVVVRRDGNLGPVARLPNNVHDFDDLLGDLRDFQLKEGLHEEGA